MKRLKFFLEQHDIKTKIENDILFVLNEWFLNGKKFAEWINANDWTKDDALLFLGYELIEE